jgi:hypothetical protein
MAADHPIQNSFCSEQLLKSAATVARTRDQRPRSRTHHRALMVDAGNPAIEIGQSFDRRAT